MRKAIIAAAAAGVIAPLFLAPMAHAQTCDNLVNPDFRKTCLAADPQTQANMLSKLSQVPGQVSSNPVEPQPPCPNGASPDAQGHCATGN
jgi:hypothetical protein